MAGTKSLLLFTLFSLIILQVAGVSVSACHPKQHLCKSPHGNSCCSKDEKCIVGKCFPKKPPGKNPCVVPSAVVCHTPLGLLCCAKDQKCGKNQCIPKIPVPDTCDPNTTPCGNIDGVDCCLDSSESCSNGICVDNTFCRPETITCHISTGLLCCGLDQTCGDNECVNTKPDSGDCDAGTTACVNIDGTSCCTADQTCNAGICGPK